MKLFNVYNNLNVEDSMIFIVDMQEKLMPVIENSEEIINNNVKLIKLANILNIPVTVTEQYPIGLGYTVKELKELLNCDRIYVKTSFSGLTGKVLKTLEEKRVNSVILSGVETHVCVLFTARDLIDKGYEVYLLEDCVSSRRLSNKVNALNQLNKIGVNITNFETVAFDLIKSSEHENFREISKLIK